MSRYRPPVAASSPYITRAGFERLHAEQGALWERRRHVVAALSAAAAEGDRSENAEYHYRKKELGGIDRRIRYLQRRLPKLDVVDLRAGGDRVRFGAEVALERSDGDGAGGGAGGEGAAGMHVRIVGADEIDPATRSISIDSPLARALVGKRTGDEVRIEVEGRALGYEVLDVSWPVAEEPPSPGPAAAPVAEPAADPPP